MCQVEVAHQDVESVLDPLLNAPCFGCKNSDTQHRQPKFPWHLTSIAMLYCGIRETAVAFTLFLDPHGHNIMATAGVGTFRARGRGKSNLPFMSS
jgi:hypothetical protein